MSCHTPCHAEQHDVYMHEPPVNSEQTRAKRLPSLPTDLALSLDESSAARLARFWLPVSGLEALLSATASTGAAAEEGLVVCAGVAGLCAAAVWTGVLAGVPASAGAYVDKMSCQSAWWIASAWCITSDC